MQNKMLAEFRKFADQKITEHTSQIKEKYNSGTQLESKTRLSVFNDHLDELKTQLKAEVDKLMAANDTASAEIRRLLDNRAESYINEFYRSEF